MARLYADGQFLGNISTGLMISAAIALVGRLLRFADT
jgi:hypothetical protein